MNPKTNFIVSTSPHIRAEEGTADIMRWVCIALAPAFGVAFYNFGIRALAITAISIASCVITEYACQKLRGVPVTTGDFSAVLSGLLLAAILPPNVSWWIPAIGGIFAIAIVKQAFGGLGSNIWNPALAARALLQVSFPTQINSPVWPYIRENGQSLMQRLSFYMNGAFSYYEKLSNSHLKEMDNLKNAIESVAPGVTLQIPASAVTAPDVISQATVLTALKNATVHTNGQAITQSISMQDIFHDHYYKMVWDSFIGLEGGCIAEVSALALLLGGLFLLCKKIITWETPFFYLATVALLTWALPAPFHTDASTCYTAWFSGPVLLQLCGGGLILGAFFMDTDYVTTPMTRNGKIIFAIGCGIITALIRLYSGSYPEGCCYSILIMNTCVPLIDSWTRPKKFGDA